MTTNTHYAPPDPMVKYAVTIDVEHNGKRLLAVALAGPFYHQELADRAFPILKDRYPGCCVSRSQWLIADMVDFDNYIENERSDRRLLERAVVDPAAFETTIIELAAASHASALAWLERKFDRAS
jgi:hypothetical protein